MLQFVLTGSLTLVRSRTNWLQSARGNPAELHGELPGYIGNLNWEDCLYVADDQVTRGSLIAPHQFEKANRIAHRMDLAHLIGVNGCNRDRLDLVACAAGDD